MLTTTTDRSIEHLVHVDPFGVGPIPNQRPVGASLGATPMNDFPLL
jgi:hypothetical protein